MSALDGLLPAGVYCISMKQSRGMVNVVILSSEELG